jgi:hypothetical protein
LVGLARMNPVEISDDIAPLIITTASAYSKQILLVTTMERRTWNTDPFAPETKVAYFVETRPNCWSESESHANIVSVTRYKYPERDRQILVALTAEGHVGFFGKEEGFYEKIPGAGLYADDAEGRGYMGAIRQIGDRLYACGRGQLYLREAPARWERVEAVVKDVVYEDVNGPNEKSIYLVGQTGVAHWNGTDRFEELATPSSSWLQRIYVQDEKTIWICGARGTLLLGNHVDGFRDVAPGSSSERLLSVARFEERLYLASHTGLHVLDGEHIRKVSTSLVPDLVDGHIVDVIDGVLWSVGYRDIARFDGRRWERVDLPGNPPIR